MPHVKHVYFSFPRLTINNNYNNNYYRGKHPLSSTAVMYLPRHLGGGGLRFVEQEYKLTKLKAAVKLYQNVDPTMSTVRLFEERAVEEGHCSLLTEAHKYAEELEIILVYLLGIRILH